MEPQNIYVIDKAKFVLMMEKVATIWQEVPGAQAPSREGWAHLHRTISEEFGLPVTYDQYVTTVAMVYLETILEAAFDNEAFSNSLSECITVRPMPES